MAAKPRGIRRPCGPSPQSKWNALNGGSVLGDLHDDIYFPAHGNAHGATKFRSTRITLASSARGWWKAILPTTPTGIEHAAGGPILGDAIATQIFEVLTERRLLEPVPYDPRLDHRAARSIALAPGGREARRLAAAEGAATRAAA
jgi:hypothetical protein